jgi:ABC-2 type transport system permease protein
MGAETAAATGEQTVQKFRSPGTVIARFVARSVSKTAAIVGYGFAIYVVSSIYGFTKTYATQASRETLAKLFGNNAGLQALFGVAHHIDTVRGFTAWRTLGVLTIVGAIWGLAVATKRFRGEEEQGRWELFLSGQTTSRQGALNNMAGLGVGLFIIFALVAIVTGIIGNVNHQHFGASEILFYTVALVASTAVFMAVGALVSQIMPTRRRAVGTAAALFGVTFLLRAIGDASKSAHWLTYLSPLGWIENTRPLTGSSPLWLIPVLGLIVVLGALTVYLAGRRDLGASLVPDKDTARPRTRFLNTTFGLALRETRAGVIAWVAALGVAGLGMGAVAKAAGEAMAASTGAHKFFTNITSQRAIGAQTYLGVVFLMVMTVLMAMAASGVNSMREDEAEGYLDNLLVRPGVTAQVAAGAPGHRGRLRRAGGSDDRPVHVAGHREPARRAVVRQGGPGRGQLRGPGGRDRRSRHIDARDQAALGLGRDVRGDRLVFPAGAHRPDSQPQPLGARHVPAAPRRAGTGGGPQVVGGCDHAGDRRRGLRPRRDRLQQEGPGRAMSRGIRRTRVHSCRHRQDRRRTDRRKQYGR